MNCLNFVYKPQGFASRPEMDALYNAQVRRFYDSKGYRRRFARRLWQHRWSLWHVLKNLPRTIQAARYFSAGKADLERACNDIAPHPRQPRGLTPRLSPDLTAACARCAVAYPAIAWGRRADRAALIGDGRRGDDPAGSRQTSLLFKGLSALLQRPC